MTPWDLTTVLVNGHFCDLISWPNLRFPILIMKNLEICDGQVHGQNFDYLPTVSLIVVMVKFF